MNSNITKNIIMKSGSSKNLIYEEIVNLFKKVYNLVEINEFENYNNELRKKIRYDFLHSQYILKSKIQDEFFIQNGIKYLFKYLIKDEIKNKSIAANWNGLTSDDPLGPPFKEGNLVEEENFGNLGTHRIFLNKFAVMDEHVLLVTRDFHSQLLHLTIDDIKNSVLLMNLIDGVIFFNGGKNSGASQKRKHLQAIPFTSMYDRQFGIFLLINERSNLIPIEEFKEFPYEIEFCHIKQFSDNGISHCLINFSEIFSKKIKDIITIESLDLYAEIIFSLNNLALDYLNLLEDNEKITINYSILLTSNWLFITPRKNCDVIMDSGILNINSVGYLMTILIKNEYLGEELKNKDILKDLYAELSYRK